MEIESNEERFVVTVTDDDSAAREWNLVWAEVSEGQLLLSTYPSGPGFDTYCDAQLGRKETQALITWITGHLDQLGSE